LAKRNVLTRDDGQEKANQEKMAVRSQPADENMNPLTSKIATVAAVGLGVALIEVELIPGMLIGVAAVLAPSLLPKIGNALRPVFKYAVRAGYAIAERTKQAVSEASEQVQDIVAEVQSEQGTVSPGSGTPHRETA
jgi:hypothetical protein